MNEKNNEFSIIPSIRMIKDLSYALTLKNEYILLSEAHIGNLKSLVDTCHKANKKAIVNVELIGGLNLDKTGIHLLKKLYQVDMVICSSTAKLNMMKSIGLKTIQRITLMDSKSFDTSAKAIVDSKCDLIEVRPGVYGLKYRDKFKKIKDVPMILGGFVEDELLVEEAKKAGFIGVTTSCKDLWHMKTK